MIRRSSKRRLATSGTPTRQAWIIAGTSVAPTIPSSDIARTASAGTKSSWM